MKKFDFGKAALIATALAVLFFVAIFIVNGYGKKNLSPLARQATVTGVTDASYEKAVGDIFAAFKTGDEKIAKETAADLLDLTVPADRKDAHFAVVTKLVAYAEALASGPGKAEERAFMALADAYPWLKNIPAFSAQ